MPDEERTVAQLAAAFRQVLDEEERERPEDRDVDSARERTHEAVLAVTGAALGDPGSLRRNEPDAEA